MTKLLEQAFDRAHHLPPEMQDDLARMILSYADDDDPIRLTPDEEAAIARSLDAAARGEFATEDQMHAIRAKYGLRKSVTRCRRWPMSRAS